MDDALAELGRDVLTPEANIIKLPNISASVPQLKAAIAELQAKGFAVPDYPEDPQRRRRARGRSPATGRSWAARSTRCCARATRTAGPRPRSSTTPGPTRTAWARGRPDSKTNVAHMDGGRLPVHRAVRRPDGRRPACRSSWWRPTARPRRCGRRSRCWPARWSTPPCCGSADLRAFLDRQIARAKAEGVLFSVHLKATMMKVSDPIIFGHVVRAFFPQTFAAYGDTLAAAGLSPNDGWAPSSTGSPALPDGDAIRRLVRRRAGRRAAARHGGLRPGHHQPPRAERRDRGRLDAGDDPDVRATCGAPTGSRPTPWP